MTTYVPVTYQSSVATKTLVLLTPPGGAQPAPTTGQIRPRDY
jgi:hypothetical protein